MTGQLAIYDLAKLEKGATLPKPKLITLAETHSDTPSDSQGLPRLLDGIALSPMAAKPGCPTCSGVSITPSSFRAPSSRPSPSSISMKRRSGSMKENSSFADQPAQRRQPQPDRLQPVRGALRRRWQAGLPDPGGFRRLAGVRPVAQRQAEQQPPPPQEVSGAPRRPSSCVTCRARIRAIC